jgi:ParB-like chromosome segregation protein Spo0J
MLERIQVPFELLRPNRHRPTTGLVRALCYELKRSGRFRNPILVKRQNKGKHTVVVGANRYAAMCILGWEGLVDCVVVANQGDISLAMRLYT